MEITFDRVDDLNAILQVKVERSDYVASLDSELVKFRKSANMKGFRKGRVPIGVIRKLYGKGVLLDVVNKKLQEAVNDYLLREKIHTLGHPILQDEHQLDFSVANPEDYDFRFDLGLAPAFEVKGLSSGDEYKMYSVEISADELNHELDHARQHHGPWTAVDENISAKDRLVIKAAELNTSGVKEDGLEAEFTIAFSQLQKEIQDSLLGKSKGEIFDCDIFELRPGSSDQYVKKNILQLEDGENREFGRNFRCKVELVERKYPAELNSEFYDAQFGPGNVNSEEEAKSWIRNSMQDYFHRQAESILYRDMQDKLLEVNDFGLPDDFLKRWLKSENPKLSTSQIEDQYDFFAKNLRWTLIKGKIVKENELEVSQEEIRDAFRHQVLNYFGGQVADEAFLGSMVDRMMKEDKHVSEKYEDLMADKVFEVMRQSVSIVPNPVSREEFLQIMEAARAAANQSRLSGVDTDEEE